MSPMCAIPATSVEKTSGAMIILIRRRNKAVTMLRYSAIDLSRSALAGVPSSIAALIAQPAMMPEHQRDQDVAGQSLGHSVPLARDPSRQAAAGVKRFTAAKRFG